MHELARHAAPINTVNVVSWSASDCQIFDKYVDFVEVIFFYLDYVQDKNVVTAFDILHIY